jgi:hypothetical protein
MSGHFGLQSGCTLRLRQRANKCHPAHIHASTSTKRSNGPAASRPNTTEGRAIVAPDERDSAHNTSVAATSTAHAA